MAAKSNKNTTQKRLEKATKIGLYGLGLQFVLGIITALWHIPPSEETPTHKSPAFASLSFDSHMLLALLLVIWSIYLLTLAVKSKNKAYKNFSIGCLVSVIVAFLGGSSIFYAPESLVTLGLFVMGLGFLGAFFHYGRLYLSIKTS